MKQERFSGIKNSFINFLFDIYLSFRKRKRSPEKTQRYGRIEAYDVEFYESRILFVGYVFEPVYDRVGVPPLIVIQFFSQVCVDLFEVLFTNFTYMGLAWVQKSALK